jgi:cell division protein FtsN
MKDKLFFAAVLFILSLLIPACSSTKQTTTGTGQKQETKKDSLYVFDQVPQNTSTVKRDTGIAPNNVSFNENQNLSGTSYVVQIGAFTTQERANEFADSSRTKIQYRISVSFNPDVSTPTGQAGLYVVQLTQHYASHDDAEKVRNELWKMNEFKDAWIVTEKK